MEFRKTGNRLKHKYHNNYCNHNCNYQIQSINKIQKKNNSYNLMCIIKLIQLREFVRYINHKINSNYNNHCIHHNQSNICKMLIK